MAEFTIEDYDPDDPEVQAALGEGCQHPDGDGRDLHRISGQEVTDGDVPEDGVRQ